jgi:predicted XRE-type DNA-binding protein
MPALQSTLRALSHEVTERALLFASAGCLNAVAYEKTTGDKVARLLLVIDGFRELSSRLDFENSFRDQATPAGQLWTILRTGRSQGIQVMLCLDSASSQSLSDSLLPFFQNKMVGSVSAAEAARLFDVGAIMPVDRKSGSLAFVDSRLELKQFPDWEPAMVSTWLVSRKRKPGGKILSFEPESLLARANTGDPLGAIKGALSHLISSYRDREQVLTKHMAERMGVEPSTASLILNGKLERFTLDHLIKCATRLGDPHINRLIAEARRVLSVQ